jgi:hypothetical protein
MPSLSPRKSRVQRWRERCARIVKRTMDEAVVNYLKDLSRDLEKNAYAKFTSTTRT